MFHDLAFMYDEGFYVKFGRDRLGDVADVFDGSQRRIMGWAA